MTTRPIPESDSPGTINTNDLLAVFSPGQDAPFSQRILDILNAGPTGPAGGDGDTGWSPLLGVVADGERRLLRLISWEGGTGTSPAIPPTNNYIGETGLTNSAGAVDIRGARGEQGEQGERGPAGTGGGGGGGTADGVLDGLSLSFAGYDANGETTAILSASRSVGADITVDLSRLYQRADGSSIRGDGVSDNPFVVSIPNVVSSLQNLHGDARLDASAIKNLPAAGTGPAGSDGTDGTSVRLLYGRYSTAPTTAPTGGSVAADFTFTTPSGWAETIPTGTDLLYAVVATITPPYPATPTYSVPFRIEGTVGERGETGAQGDPGDDGDDGAPGTNGWSAFIVFQRAASAPANLSGGSFDPTTGLTPPTGWTHEPPAGSDALYSSTVSVSPTGVIAYDPPVPAGQDGAPGQHGRGAAIIFSRAASQPTTPMVTYASGALQLPAGWSLDLDSLTGTDPIWQAYVNVAPDDTVVVSTPLPPGTQGAQGPRGEAGADGDAIFVIYHRGPTAPAAPSGGTYDTATGLFTPPSGWSHAVPPGDDDLYIIFVAIDRGRGITYSSPLTFGTAADGASVFILYQRSATTPTASGGSYDRDDRALTPPDGWTSGIPSGDDPLWVLLVNVNRSGGIRYAPPFSFSASGGARVFPIFRRAFGVIAAAPTGGSYNFSSGVFTPPTNWNLDVPSGTGRLYMSFARVESDGDIIYNLPLLLPVIPAPEKLLLIFRRTLTAPTTPTGGSYDRDTETFTPPADWSNDVPTGTTTLYMVAAYINGAGVTTDIDYTDPIPLGGSGDGSHGASVYVIYQRSSTALSTPTGGSYDTATGVFSPPSGWSQSVPTGSEPLYLVFVSISGDGTISYHAPLAFTVRPSPTEIRDDLQGLTGGERLSASAIQGLPTGTGGDPSVGPRLSAIESLTSDLHEFGNRGVRAAVDADGVTAHVLPVGIIPTTENTRYSVAQAVQAQTTGVIWLRRTAETIPLRNFRIRVTDSSDTTTYESFEGGSFDVTTQAGQTTYWYTRQGTEQYVPTVNITAARWIRVDRYLTDRHTYYDGALVLPGHNTDPEVKQVREIRWGDSFGVESWNGTEWIRTATQEDRVAQHSVEAVDAARIPAGGLVLSHNTGNESTLSYINSENHLNLQWTAGPSVAYYVGNAGNYTVEAQIPVKNHGISDALLRVEMVSAADNSAVLARGASLNLPPYATGFLTLSAFVPLPANQNFQFMVVDALGYTPVEILAGGVWRLGDSETFSGNFSPAPIFATSLPTLPAVTGARTRPTAATGVIETELITRFLRAADQPDPPPRQYTAPTQAYFDIDDTDGNPAVRLSLDRAVAIGAAGNAYGWQIRNSSAVNDGQLTITVAGTNSDTIILDIDGQWSASELVGTITIAGAGARQSAPPQVYQLNAALLGDNPDATLRLPAEGDTTSHQDFTGGAPGSPATYTDAEDTENTYLGRGEFALGTSTWDTSDPDDESSDTLWVATSLARQLGDGTWEYQDWSVLASGIGTYYTQYSTSEQGPWGDFSEAAVWVRHRRPNGSWETPQRLYSRRSEWRQIGETMQVSWQGPGNGNVFNLGRSDRLLFWEFGEVLDVRDYSDFALRIFTYQNETFSDDAVVYWVPFDAQLVRGRTVTDVASFGHRQTMIARGAWDGSQVWHYRSSLSVRELHDIPIYNNERVWMFNFRQAAGYTDFIYVDALRIINVLTRGSFRFEFWARHDSVRAP